MSEDRRWGLVLAGLATAFAAMIGGGIYSIVHPTGIPVEDFVILVAEHYPPCRAAGGTETECRQRVRDHWPR
jgi:hypothetical protein